MDGENTECPYVGRSDRDKHVFVYDSGRCVMCDNSGCEQQSGAYLIDGEEPVVGICENESVIAERCNGVGRESS